MKRRAYTIISLLFLVFTRTSLLAQNPGQLDPSFNTTAGANDVINVMAVQPDGKILIGGQFDEYNGKVRRGIARINPDGSLDDSFNPGTGTAYVNAISLKTDGKLIIAGGFTFYNNVQRGRIARINSNGSLDLTFNTGKGADGNIDAMAMQPDGKLVIGGLFFEYDGKPVNRLARINANGSFDAGFIPATKADWIPCLALQPDGKVLVAEGFRTLDGGPRIRVARYNANGSLDTGFKLGIGAEDATSNISSIAVQPDGKILLAGRFNRNAYNDMPCNHMVRLNTDGTVDLTFNVREGAGGEITKILLQPDGKILVAGNFLEFNETEFNRIVRLHPDGSIDSSFQPGNASNDVYSSFIIYNLAFQSDGKLLISGTFKQYNGIPCNRITRLFCK